MGHLQVLVSREERERVQKKYIWGGKKTGKEKKETSLKIEFRKLCTLAYWRSDAFS